MSHNERRPAHVCRRQGRPKIGAHVEGKVLDSFPNHLKVGLQTPLQPGELTKHNFIAVI